MTLLDAFPLRAGPGRARNRPLASPCTCLPYAGRFSIGGCGRVELNPGRRHAEMPSTFCWDSYFAGLTRFGLWSALTTHSNVDVSCQTIVNFLWDSPLPRSYRQFVSTMTKNCSETFAGLLEVSKMRVENLVCLLVPFFVIAFDYRPLKIIGICLRLHAT